MYFLVRCIMLLVHCQSQCMRRCFCGWWWELTNPWTPSSPVNTSLVCWTLLDLRSLMWVWNKIQSSWTLVTFLFKLLSPELMLTIDFITVQHLWTAVHQLHQWKTATVFQPPHVCAGAGRVQERRHWMDFHRFWYGLAGLYWPNWKGEIAGY